ncbi:MAG: hypothetical protein ACFFCQ_04750, partial [Promethearchaeota archaeon]
MATNPKINKRVPNNKEKKQAQKIKNLASNIKEIKHLYEMEWYNSTEIGNIYGVDRHSIIDLLVANNVPIRTSGESRRLVALRTLPMECRYQEYMEDLYLIQKMSLNEMARMFQTHHKKIASLLTFHKIPIRGLKKAKQAYYERHANKKPSKELMSVLEGIVTSDGSLIGKKYVTAVNLTQSRRHAEYCYYIRDWFLSEGIHANTLETTHIRKKDNHKGGFKEGQVVETCVMYSQGLVCLNDMYERFYPNRETIELKNNKGIYYR